jgi:hypothetical protein
MGNSTVANIVQAFGNGGPVGNTTTTAGGGGTWQANSTTYLPQPNSLIPGGSGSGNQAAGLYGGGGGSLFCPAGQATSASISFSEPATIYNASNKVGQFGGGANGCDVLTSTRWGAGGGAQGCYKYSIACSPGDVFTLTLPGCCYVMANGATGTNGGPGGESYAMIQYNA